MKFSIKIGDTPSLIETTDWIAGEDQRTGIPFLNICKRPFLLDSESFELIYFLSQAKLLNNDNMVIALNGRHVDIWRI